MFCCLSDAARSRSISIVSTWEVCLRRRRVSAPSPGPISTTQSEGWSDSASMIFSSTLGSWRKCCPNRLRGLCELDGKVERLDQAAGIGAAAAGKIERRAVVDRGAHERQPEGGVDAATEARVLQHRQPLVVIHRERAVGALQ